MRWTIALLTSILLLAGCASVEETADPEEELEPLSLPEVMSGGEEIDEELFPEWFKVGIRGEARGGELQGYAKSRGSDVDWAVENARRQAEVNLRSWIDRQVEAARSEVANVIAEAGDREFILQLRNAVISLEFSGADVVNEDFEDHDGELHAVVRITTPASGVLQELEASLEDYPEIWQHMVESGPLQSW